MTERNTGLARFTGDLSREPDGRPQNLLWLGSAAVFYALTVYYLVVNGQVTPFTPLIATVFAVGGIAESLPADRPTLVYRLRLLTVAMAAIIAVLGLVALVGGPAFLF